MTRRPTAQYYPVQGYRKIPCFLPLKPTPFFTSNLCTHVARMYLNTGTWTFSRVNDLRSFYIFDYDIRSILMYAKPGVENHFNKPGIRRSFYWRREKNT